MWRCLCRPIVIGYIVVCGEVVFENMENLALLNSLGPLRLHATEPSVKTRRQRIVGSKQAKREEASEGKQASKQAGRQASRQCQHGFFLSRREDAVSMLGWRFENL
ncbi:conserved hypothetical protein [Trichinella spiralis]|uniref:hypothetical protein n=1 Tax=Trichinella spiralis TaxID=6334 RepID=UPI0001EFCDE7|nr:conserved hypothetical protein [Trichinella spiralis]